MMRKMLFALATLVVGAFAFAGGSTSASAAPVSPAAAVSDSVRTGNIESVTYYYRRGYRRRGYCYYYPWRCERPYYRRHYYYRPHWRHRRDYW
jgi:hypothetical protein